MVRVRHVKINKANIGMEVNADLAHQHAIHVHLTHIVKHVFQVILQIMEYANAIRGNLAQVALLVLLIVHHALH